MQLSMYYTSELEIMFIDSSVNLQGKSPCLFDQESIIGQELKEQ